jgi:hypothetical protein
LAKNNPFKLRVSYGTTKNLGNMEFFRAQGEVERDFDGSNHFQAEFSKTFDEVVAVVDMKVSQVVKQREEELKSVVEAREKRRKESFGPRG